MKRSRQIASACRSSVARWSDTPEMRVRTAEENGPLLLDDHHLVAHRGHVGPARRARAEHERDLGNAGRRHARLVEEDAPEVLAVGKHVGLERQERAAGVDEVDAGQAVLERDLLGAEVLLDGDRVVGTALHGGVVGDDHRRPAVDRADPGEHAGARRAALVHAVGRERRQLEERRAGIEEPVDALTGGELAALGVLGARRGSAAGAGGLEVAAQLVDGRAHGGGVLLELRRVGADAARDLRCAHEGLSWESSRD